jgi:uncharacterized delta-60 repeat protein
MRKAAKIWRGIFFVLAVFGLFGVFNKVQAANGANSTVLATAIQSDGKVIIGGAFTDYNGAIVNHIARLNTNGTLDTTFNPGAGANNAVNAIAIQSDGKIIIGGDFTEYNGVARNHIARLNTDGTLDTTFNSGTGANNVVNAIAIQSDGKIIIGGSFYVYNSVNVQGVARLNTDGAFDTTFASGLGIGGNTVVLAVTIQSDGKIIIGGEQFTIYGGRGGYSSGGYNGAPIENIARLNTDGTLDTTFTTSIGNSAPFAATIQSDGKIIIGGYLGGLYNYIARLNTDGTRDTVFNLGGTGSDNWVRTTAIQSDGRIIIGGTFYAYNGTSRGHVARLNTDGTLDITFNSNTNASFNGVCSIAIQSDGKIIIGGDFTEYNGAIVNHIARLNNDGTLDTTFNS